jgi:hypothetical protein
MRDVSKLEPTRGCLGRRALTVIAVLGIAAAGAAWSGCGDDDADEAEQEIEQAIEEGEEEAEQAGEEAEQQIEEGAEEAEQQIEEGAEEGGEGGGGGGGYGGGG